MDAATWIAVIAAVGSAVAAIGAILAGVLGPLFALKGAKLQARATAVSNNRQQWINSVREEVAGLLADVRALHSLPVVRVLSEQEQSDKTALSLRLRLRLNRLRLLLNPNEADHNELVRLISEAMKSGASKESDQDEIFAHCQRILKREWERVKAGD
jgi:hypothetical protein